MNCSIGDKLRALRLAHGMTLRQFAKILDVTPATVSRIECNVIMVSWDKVEKITGHFGLTIKEFLEVYK